MGLEFAARPEAGEQKREPAWVEQLRSWSGNKQTALVKPVNPAHGAQLEVDVAVHGVSTRRIPPGGDLCRYLPSSAGSNRSLA